jgi:hypothetical protein
MMPMSQRRAKKSTIDTGLGALTSRGQFQGHFIGTDYLANLGRRGNGAMGINP